MGEGGSVVANHRRSGEDPGNGTRTSRVSPSSADVPDQAGRPPRPVEPEPAADPERDRRLRRARFLAELAEARELRKRVTPRRTRAAELHARVLRTFRY